MSAVAVAGGPQLAIEAAVEAGVDANAFRTPSQRFDNPAQAGADATAATATPAALVLPAIDAELKWQLSETLAIEVDSDWQARLYPGDGPVRNASGYTARLEPALDWQMVRAQGLLRQLDLGFGAGGKVRSYAFISRVDGTRRGGEAEEDDAENDQYRYRQLLVHMRTRLRSSGGSTLVMRAEAGRRDYVGADAVAGSLDRDLSGGSLVILQKLPADLGGRLSVEYLAQRYRERRAINTEGRSVDGTRRRYRDLDAIAALSWRPERMHLRLGLDLFRRTDEYANYWSYTDVRASLSARWQALERLTLEGQSSVAKRRYDKETNPQGDVRERLTLAVSLVVTATMTSLWSLRASVRAKRQNDTDPYYGYNDFEAVAGVLMTL